MTAEAPTTEPAVEVGRTADGGTPLAINLESLRRHTVIFAGSGSGKTVLIRRLVEECARQGVSAIVLDPNNDLARLGDAWPEPPNGWLPGDDTKAKDYLDHTEVVIWTPRISAGRPIAFQPLPDFRPVRDSADEFDQAVRSAVEALAPRAGVNGATKLAKQGKAVLTEALQAYASERRVGLRGFTDFLTELPDGVSRMARAAKLAHDLAETLKAAMITDPLFGGEGTPADPSMLLTPSRGKRARVSVISFVGLTSNEERQSFVNQLQMALFAWIKRNPAGDRPLGGIFVMDEAQTLAPSTGHTACTASTIALASQARKYGLGLVFATQAPKGLHNQISGNATTQFFGLLNSPAQIDAARELAASQGRPATGHRTARQWTVLCRRRGILVRQDQSADVPDVPPKGPAVARGGYPTQPRCALDPRTGGVRHPTVRGDPGRYSPPPQTRLPEEPAMTDVAKDPWEGTPVSPHGYTPPQPPPQHNITVAPRTEVNVNIGAGPVVIGNKSVGVAYLLWVLLGWFGGHKFYLNRPGMGVLYLFTAGLLIIGWLVDAFTLPGQVRRRNVRGY